MWQRGRGRRKLLRWKMSRVSSLSLTSSCVFVIPLVFYPLFRSQQSNNIQQKIDSSLSFLRTCCAFLTCTVKLQYFTIFLQLSWRCLITFSILLHILPPASSHLPAYKQLGVVGCQLYGCLQGKYIKKNEYWEFIIQSVCATADLACGLLQ